MGRCIQGKITMRERREERGREERGRGRKEEVNIK